MEPFYLSLLMSAVALLISIITFFQWNKSRSVKPAEEKFQTRPLQLQAYERLVVLTERISLSSLVSRANTPGLSAKEMQVLLLETIKTEFEYNSSQQIYVSPVAWQAMKNLKEQNMLVINQVAQSLPEDAKGIDLNKRIMEVVMAQDKNSLHNIVLEALNWEARKLMK